MAEVHTNEWMTTFVFNQDLRSYYFNNLLFSVVKPGVYNSDISLGTTASSTSSKLFLTIKKGTTLLFTNDYVKNEITGRYRRNFGSNENNENFNDNVVLVKCVAREDYEYQNFTFENKTIPNERLYVISYFQYNPNASIASANIPRFGLFKRNTVQGTSAYFSSVLSETGISIPEGQTAIDNGTDGVLMYLILGVIEASNTESYNTFSEAWFKSHAFVCKGLPDYRYPIVNTKNTPSPDVIENFNAKNKVSTLYVDWSKICIDGDYYDSSAEWDEVYELTEETTSLKNASQISGSSDRTGLYITDSEYGVLKNGGLVVDYIFAKTFNFENSTSLNNISSLNFNTTSTESLPLVTYRYIDTTFTPTVLSPKHYTGSNTIFTIYLDKGKTNKERLLNFIKNRGFMKKVVNNIRQEKLVEGYTSIIPVAIAFRYFGENYSTLDTFTSRTSVNPSNVLCLLDLAMENKNYNNLISPSRDVYNVLSVID